MSVLGKIGKIFTPKSIGWALGGPAGLLAGAIFDQKRGQYRNTRSTIEDAYRSAQQRQLLHESDVRQGSAESLASRGLLTNGAVNPGASKIANAMGAQSGYLMPSSTIGQRQQAETSQQLGLERHDLDAAHTQALNENKASYINDLINTGVGAVKSAASFAGAGGDIPTSASIATGGTQATMDAIAGQSIPGVQYAAPKIASAMGAANPDNWWGGIHGVDPLNTPGSSWNRKTTISAPGASNADFHL
jgi:hypothetical protein